MAADPITHEPALRLQTLDVVEFLQDPGVLQLAGEVLEHGTVANTPVALQALAVKLAAMGRELRFCYPLVCTIRTTRTFCAFRAKLSCTQI